MNKEIQNLTLNSTSAEIISILGDPLLEKVEGDVKLMVYTSKLSTKADVLYFIDDRLILKSMSTDAVAGKNLEASLGEPEQVYSLLADERGTAAEQWLGYWQTKGIALVSDSKLRGGVIERVLNFDPMPFEQLSKIWGGAKFVKASEQVVGALSATESAVREPAVADSASMSDWQVPIFAAIAFTLLLIVLVVLLRVKKKNMSPPPESLPTPPVAPPVSQI